MSASPSSPDPRQTSKAFAEEKEEERSVASFRQQPKAGGGREQSGVSSDARSSYKERKGNALASGADEGRDKLR